MARRRNRWFDAHPLLAAVVTGVLWGVVVWLGSVPFDPDADLMMLGALVLFGVLVVGPAAQRERRRSRHSRAW